MKNKFIWEDVGRIIDHFRKTCALLQLNTEKVRSSGKASDCIREVPVLISTGASTILTEDSRGFPLSFHVSAGVKVKIFVPVLN
jgi:hypothetical protein